MMRALALTGLLATSFLVFPTLEGAAAGTHPMPINALLCDSAVHAIQFADVMAKEDSEEIAKDRVGRLAQAEVCGRYVGIATIESEQVTLRDGTAYKVTAYRFQEDSRVAWLAQTTFAPVSSNWDL